MKLGLFYDFTLSKIALTAFEIKKERNLLILNFERFERG